MVRLVTRSIHQYRNTTKPGTDINLGCAGQRSSIAAARIKHEVRYRAGHLIRNKAKKSHGEIYDIKKFGRRFAEVSLKNTLSQI